MKNLYNLSTTVSLDNFPWDEVIVGISKSTKKASIFYGVSNNNAGLTPEESTWHTALTESAPLKGLDILLTKPQDETKWNSAWYNLGYSNFWAPTKNIEYFPGLQAWIQSSGVFKETGRQIIFIQMQFSSTPRHVDQDPARAPEGYKDPPEFLWITNHNGKRLLVQGESTDNVCWFNSYVPHETLPDSGLKWSLRIDGKFTDEFKNKLKQL
jgi:hypothetical protein